MSWFTKKRPEPEPACCYACRLYFKPQQSSSWWENPESKNICWNCDKPHRERRKRIHDVRVWAADNWEKLEPQMEKDRERQKRIRAKNAKKHPEIAALQQQAAMQAAYQNYFYSSNGLWKLW